MLFCYMIMMVRCENNYSRLDTIPLYSNRKGSVCIWTLLHSAEFSIKYLSFVSLSLFRIHFMVVFNLRRGEVFFQEVWKIKAYGKCC